MVPMVSGTTSISKEETSRLTSFISRGDKPNSSIVSNGVFTLPPFSE
jgi:hypothetical protein